MNLKLDLGKKNIDEVISILKENYLNYKKHKKVCENG